MRYRALLLMVVVATIAGSAACAKILGIREEAPKAFPHRSHAVEGINCVQCHSGVISAGDHGELNLPDEQSCRGCHEEPHDQGPCLSCHTEPSTRRRATERKEHLLFRHDQHLVAAHGNCMDCHLGVAGEGGDIRAPMGACLGCHEHRDEFRILQCEQCHVDLHSEVATPDSHLVHDEDFARRHGVQAQSSGELCATCHQESSCLACHGVNVPALPSRLNMNDPMGPGMHRANFFARHSIEAQMDPGLCTTCHTPSSCIDCHRRSSVRLSGPGAISPHPPGWVSFSGQNAHGREARLDPVACASCHGGAGEALCVGCHQVGGVCGSPHGSNFNSRLDRDQMPCRMCHTGAGAP